VMPNILHDLALEIRLGSKDSPGDDIALDLGEPDLHLVQPGRVGGCVVNLNRTIGLQELIHPFGFVSGEVIDDDMNLLFRRLSGDQLFKESHELRTGVSFGRLANNRSGADVQSGVKGKCSVPVILEPMMLSPSRRERQHRIKPIECLNRSLFIDAKHCCVNRRLEIKANDIGSLALEVRVIARLVTAQSMRLKARLRPHSNHSRLIGSQLGRESATAPLRCSVRGLPVKRPVNDPRFEFLATAFGLPTSMAAINPGEAIGGESISPQPNRIHTTAFSRTDNAQRRSSRKRQDNSRPSTVFASRFATAGHRLKFLTLGRTDHDPCCHGEEDT